MDKRLGVAVSFKGSRAVIQYLHMSNELKAGAAVGVGVLSAALAQIASVEDGLFGKIVQGGSFGLLVLIVLWVGLKWYPQQREDARARDQFLLDKFFAHYDSKEAEHKELVTALKENTRALREFKQENVEELRRLAEAHKQAIDSLKGAQ